MRILVAMESLRITDSQAAVGAVEKSQHTTHRDRMMSEWFHDVCACVVLL